MKKVIHTVFFSVLFVKCSEIGKKPPAVSNKEAVQVKPGSSYHDTLVIRDACAIFYQPDSIQKEEIKKLTEPGVFESSMHEFFYQQKNAHAFLKQHYPYLKVIDANNKRFLLFVKNDKSSELIDINEKGDSYGMFLFDGKQSPLQLDMMNVESEVPDYFHR